MSEPPMVKEVGFLASVENLSIQGPYVIMGDFGKIFIYNWQTDEQRQISENDTHYYFMAKMSANGEALFVMSDPTFGHLHMGGRLELRDPQTLDVRQAIDVPYHIDDKDPHNWVVDPQGQFVFYLTIRPFVVHGWFPHTNHTVSFPLGPGEYGEITVTQDGKHLLAATEQSITMYDLEGHRVKDYPLRVERDSHKAAMFPGGFVFASVTGGRNSLTVWVEGEEITSPILHIRHMTNFAWNPQRRVVAFEALDQGYIWWVDHEKWTSVWKNRITPQFSLAWTSDGRYLAGLFEAESGTQLIFFDVFDEFTLQQPITEPSAQSVEAYYCHHLTAPWNQQLNEAQQALLQLPPEQLERMMEQFTHELVNHTELLKLNLAQASPFAMSREMTQLYQAWIQPRPAFQGLSALAVLEALKQQDRCDQKRCQELNQAHEVLRKVCRSIAQRLEAARQADLQQILPEEKTVPPIRPDPQTWRDFEKRTEPYQWVNGQYVSQVPPTPTPASQEPSEEKVPIQEAPPTNLLRQPGPIPVSEPYLRPGNPYATIHPEHGPPVWTRDPGLSTARINRTLQSEDPEVDRIVAELEGQGVEDPQQTAAGLQQEYDRRRMIKRQRQAARAIRRPRKGKRAPKRKT